MFSCSEINYLNGGENSSMTYSRAIQLRMKSPWQHSSASGLRNYRKYSLTGLCNKKILNIYGAFKNLFNFFSRSFHFQVNKETLN